MRIRLSFAVALFVTGIGGLVVPALAQIKDNAGNPPDRGMEQGQGARMGHGMISRGMIGSGCAGMMQSMNGDDGRPNSQWGAHPDGNTKPD
jgi:hypothetical protein